MTGGSGLPVEPRFERGHAKPPGLPGVYALNLASARELLQRLWLN
jgi:hypothetical protein